jgi:hypothetical protein
MKMVTVFLGKGRASRFIQGLPHFPALISSSLT